MKSVGIGSSEILGNADIVVPDTAELPGLDLPEIAKITENLPYPLTFSSLSIYNEI